MVEYLGEYAWVGVLLAGLGYLLAPIIGYRRSRNGNGGSHTTIQGATIIDSSIARDGVAVGEDMAVALRRSADALEGLLEVEKARDKRKSQELRDDALVSKIEALQDEISDLKRGKR